MIKLSNLVRRVEGSVELTRFKWDELARIRLMAIRRRVWFKVLSRLERGLIDLALKVTKEVRSKVLAKAICSIVKKLLEALESEVTVLMRQIGAPLARELSRIARKWGNKSAHEWVDDFGFIQYLTIMKMNVGPGG